MDKRTRVLRDAPGVGAPDATNDTTVIDTTGDDATGVAPDALIGRRLEGRYELVAPLARGGMATVYRALDTRLDREVAVKIMHATFAHDPDFVQRFEREAKAVARVSHPNVVAVYDTGLDSSGDAPVVFLVMELVDGRTLRDLIDERGKLTPPQALHILEPVLSALVAAHNAGLVHRDIKPENVLLANNGSVKVADFGLARAVEASSLTGGLLLGTMAYLAPEQVTQGDADGRTDVYAAGIVLYEMLTGTVPFSAATPMAVAYQHVHGSVPAPSATVPELVPALDALVLRATAKAPEDRYESSAAFLVATRQAVRALPTATTTRQQTMALPVSDHLTEVLPAAGRPAGPIPPAAGATGGAAEPKRWRRRPSKWVVFLVVLALISAGAATAGWWYGSGRYVRVPAVTGLTPDAASKNLSSHNLKAVTGDAVYSDTIGPGLIATTTPGVGKRLTHGTTVVLHRSLGVQMVAVPTVNGLTLSDATNALKSGGFAVGTTKHANSMSVASGSVITSDPAQGQSIKHGSTVTLTVSDGPAPVDLPNLVGLPETQANTTLASLGLTPVRSDDFSSTVPSGSVISQNPSPGTLHQGDKVSLVISKGPQMVTVPDVTKKNPGDAMSRLAQVGLQGQVIVLDGDKVVVYQTPSAGQSVAVGTTVKLYTAAKP